MLTFGEIKAQAALFVSPLCQTHFYVCGRDDMNFVAFNERDAAGILNSRQAGDPRQDDYDIWLGSKVLDTWIAWKRHGGSNVLYLDGHAKSVNRTDALLGMYPGGQVLTDPTFYAD